MGEERDLALLDYIELRIAGLIRNCPYCSGGGEFYNRADGVTYRCGHCYGSGEQIACWPRRSYPAPPRNDEFQALSAERKRKMFGDIP